MVGALLLLASIIVVDLAMLHQSTATAAWACVVAAMAGLAAGVAAGRGQGWG
ncbi:MAG: hypothetical protein U0840_25615 [Gemmataceae bacterium]